MGLTSQALKIYIDDQNIPLILLFRKMNNFATSKLARITIEEFKIFNDRFEEKKKVRNNHEKRKVKMYLIKQINK